MVNYHHSLPRTYVPTNEDRIENYPVEKRISYINRTHREVIICERSNLKLVIPAAPRFGVPQEVIVRVEYWIHEERVKINTELLLDRMRDLGDHVKVFRQAFSCNEFYGPQFRGVRFCVEYAVDQATLEDYNDSLYYKDIDLLISIADKSECPDHPFSQEAEINDAYANVLINQPSLGLNVDIYINDPKNRYGERYVNVFGKVYCIRTVKLFDRKEGIYLSKIVNGKRCDVYFTFEEAGKEINLFRVEDEALTNGHVDIILKKNLAELENTNLLLKKELDASKTILQTKQVELDARKAELDKEREEWKAEKEQEDLKRKREFERMKDKYEERSYERKDRSELLKHIPTLIIGLSTVFLAWKQASKSDG